MGHASISARLFRFSAVFSRATYRNGASPNLGIPYSEGERQFPGALPTGIFLGRTYLECRTCRDLTERRSAARQEFAPDLVVMDASKDADVSSAGSTCVEEIP
jgi:hypothetical protein